MSPIQKARAVSQAQTTLGVSVDASPDEIHNAWKKLAFDLHPDRGSNDGGALASVNAAYTLLKDRAKSMAANANTPQQEAPAGPRPVRPRSIRPSTPMKVMKIDEALRESCQELVADEPFGHGHVASAIERVGRKVTFVVDTVLAEGINRVAVPVPNFGELGGPKTTSVKFRSSKAGPGTLDLPGAICEKHFPGASSVSFRFSV